MGAVFKISLLSCEKINKLLTPVIYCVNEEKVSIYTNGCNVLNINLILSSRLMRFEMKERNLMVADEFCKIVEETHQPLLIKDFQMLFNPEYQFDVLKLFIMANRRKRMDVLWCGTYQNGKLFFAEPGYEDYKSFNIDDYDISCII